MEQEFVSYDQALRLKALGFDEPCVDILGDQYLYRNSNFCRANDGAITMFKSFDDELVTAPTYSQCFRWFREKYRLMSCITPCSDGEYIFTLYDLNKCNLEVFVEDIELFESEDSYDICEEAELACLEKLIEIVESKSE